MKRLILLFLLAAQSAFGAESVMVDSDTRNVINTGVVNFAVNQLKVDGISVIGGGGGGGGGGTDLPSMPGHNNQFLQTDGTVALWATVSFASLSGKPTTLGGYGITDAVSLTNFTWVNLGGKPTTLAGFGITDAQPLDADLTAIAALATQSFGRGALTIADAAGFRTYIGAGTSNFDGSWASLTGKPTTNFGTGGMGLTDVQPLDPDLTSLAAALGTNTIYYRSASNTWSPVTIGTNISFTGGVLSGPTGLGTGDVSSNVSTSTTGQAIVFADATGKLITPFTGSGIATLTTGVLGTISSIGATQGGTGQTAVATGDVLYGSATNTWSRLPGPTTATPVRYLRSVGTGSAANAPTWTQITFSELASIPTTVAGYGITDTFVNDSTPFSEMATGDKPAARTALGLQIGLNVQAWDTDLDQLAAISVTGGNGGSGTNIGVPWRKTAGPPSVWGTIILGTGLSFDNTTGTLTATTTGSGDVISNVTSNVAGQVAIFDINVDGKHIRPVTSGTGIAKLTSGVLSVGTAKTDYWDTSDFLPSGGTHAHGLVPDPGATAGISKFLREDATWFAPVSEGTSTGGTSGSPFAWPAGKTVMSESAALTSVDGYSTLPAANTYPSGTILTYIDSLTTANFGRNFHPQGTDTLDGVTAATMGPTWLRPFIAGGANVGQGIYQFKGNGTNAWVSVYANGNATKVQSSGDARRQVFFNVENQPADGVTHNTVTFPNTGDSTTVSPLEPIPGIYVTGVSAGVLQTAPVYQKDVLSNQDDIATVTGPANSVTGNPHTVPNTGLIDNIRLSAQITAPLTVVLPSTSSGYKNAQAMFFYDASGSLNSDNTVTLLPQGSDTVNRSTNGIILSRDHESRRIICNLSTGDWAVESYGGALGNGLNIGPQVSLTDATTIDVSCDQNLIEQNWRLLATSGVGSTRTIRVNGARQGERFRLTYTHYSTNDTVIIQSSATPANGLGLLNLSKTIGAIDMITGTVRNDGKILIENPSLNLTFAAPTTFTTQADTAPVNSGTSQINLGSVATGATKFQAIQFVAGSTYTMGALGLSLKTFGTPGLLAGGISVLIAADAERSSDTGAIVSTGNNTVTNATTAVVSDIGQRVTGPGIPDPSYIGAVDTTLHTFTVVTTKGGSTAQTIGTGGTGVHIFGTPASSPLTTGSVSAAVPVSTIPAAYPTTFATYTTFSGFTASIVSGTTYWIVISPDSPLNNNTDYIQLKCATTTGYTSRNGTAMPPTISSGTNRGNFITYTSP